MGPSMTKGRLVLLGSLLTGTAQAQGYAPTIDKSDTVWVLVASVLVLLMTPALAFFYGGLVRHRNVLSTMMHSIVLMGVGTMIWILIGFSLAFGASQGWIGGLDYLWGQGISTTSPYVGQTIPLAVFMLFQMKFAIIT